MDRNLAKVITKRKNMEFDQPRMRHCDVSIGMLWKWQGIGDLVNGVINPDSGKHTQAVRKAWTKWQNSSTNQG